MEETEEPKRTFLCARSPSKEMRSRGSEKMDGGGRKGCCWLVSALRTHPGRGGVFFSRDGVIPMSSAPFLSAHLYP